jgi:signal transduction histidine kinase
MLNTMTHTYRVTGLLMTPWIIGIVIFAALNAWPIDVSGITSLTSLKLGGNSISMTQGSDWIGGASLLLTVFLLTWQKRASDLELDKRLALAREKERIDLASDIHDGPLQDLYATRFLLNDPEDQLSALLSKVRSELREITMRLEPMTKECCLSDELSRLISWHAQRHPSVHLELIKSAEILDVSATASQMVFRIVRTALTNIHKHSDATRAELVIEQKGRSLQIILRDNGKGFDVDAFKEVSTDHYGIFLMKHYAAEIGATLNIESRIGQGTAVTIELKLTSNSRQRTASINRLLAWNRR